ncbi:MAG: diaminopimelate decarboxylase [Actinomycetota bacterium]
MTSVPIPPTLLPDTSEILENDVLVGGVSLMSVAREFGTPVFVYDEMTLIHRCKEAIASFDEGVAFASKSFLCGAMAKLAVAQGMNIDVASDGELDLVLRAGIEAKRVVLHGNNKSISEISRAIELGVHRLVVDSFDEIEKLRSLLTDGKKISCLVRVTPGIEAHTHQFVMTGQEDSKFGFSIASGDARRAIELLRENSGIEVRGVHAHIGSQIFETVGFEEELRVLIDFTREDSFREICIGGGLGVAYVEGETAPSIAQWGDAVRQVARKLGLNSNVLLTAEPGRSIVAQAGVTLYEVGVIKKLPMRTYVAVNGGMSDNPRPVLYGSGYEAFDVSRPNAKRERAVRIVGKHCESGDVLVDEAWLPNETGVGDVIATPVTGAYGYSMASNYNRVPRPAVVFVKDGKARLVLRRETLDDLARLEVE